MPTQQLAGAAVARARPDGSRPAGQPRSICSGRAARRNASGSCRMRPSGSVRTGRRRMVWRRWLPAPLTRWRRLGYTGSGGPLLLQCARGAHRAPAPVQAATRWRRLGHMGPGGPLLLQCARGAHGAPAPVRAATREKAVTLISAGRATGDDRGSISTGLKEGQRPSAPSAVSSDTECPTGRCLVCSEAADN